MSLPGLIWRHVILSTRNSWKPGDPRGWRSRGHRRHSSGDYRSPPPPEEHDGLRRWIAHRSGEVILIPAAAQPLIGRALWRCLRDLGTQVLVIAVSTTHAHLLTRLPRDPVAARRIVGSAKAAAGRAVAHLLPGGTWAAGGQFKPIRDRAHHINTFEYIRTRQGPHAWVWTFRDPPP